MASSGFRTFNNPVTARTLTNGGPQHGSLANPFIYEAAQVDQIVLNETSDDPLASYEVSEGRSTVGRIRFRRESDTSVNLIDWAYPLHPNYNMFPIVGEWVLLLKIVSDYYYIGPINRYGKITHNADPLISDALAVNSTENKLKNQLKAAKGVLSRATTTTDTVGENFIENSAKPIKSFEGDFIIHGRYGNSIRLGSSQMSKATSNQQSPNIILSVGQATSVKTGQGSSAITNESVNRDASSIYMVSDQILALVPATYGTNIHLRSLPLGTRPILSGAQILLNSDRLIFNSKDNSILLFAKKGIHLNSLEDGITLDTSGEISLRTPSVVNIFSEKTSIFDAKEDTMVSAARDIQLSASRTLTIKGNDIFLGGRGALAEPVVMGTTLKLFFLEMIRVLISTQPLTIPLTGVINPAVVARLLLTYAKYMVIPGPFNPMWASNDVQVMRTGELPRSATTLDLPLSEGISGLSASQIAQLNGIFHDSETFRKG